MGRYMRKCKGIGEVSDLEMAATKKRKISSSDGDVKLISPVLLRTGVGDTPDGSLVSPSSSVNLNDNASNLDHDLASYCSRNGSSCEENSVVASAESKETKLPSERQRTPEKLPSEKEIDDFFAAHQKAMFKRFREKYNFDFEKEEPLEGRYEWVRIGS